MLRLIVPVLLMLSSCASARELPSPRQAAAGAKAAAPPVSRKVGGQVLTSDDAPPVRIEFDKSFKYVGGQSFILYDVASAEQHFFVDADSGGRIRRLYWVQFEAYLPNNGHAYDYKSPNVVSLGGLDFIADSAARHIPAPAAGQAGQPENKISDGDRARAFLASKGFTPASGEVLWQRLVHMADESRRSELMIIYLEDLGGAGLTAADLSPGGRASARWEETAKALLERARKGLTVTRR
ncbi:MAG TPA: hypothetical protein VNZ44_18225 [Pyrinomonadaceae bacterium]|nr:hypothetical protein [Pyrinomonadaceae bacterium]